MEHQFSGAASGAIVAGAFAAGLIIGVVGVSQITTPDPGRYLDLANSHNVADVVSLCAMWPDKFKTKTADMEACQLARSHFMTQTFRKE